MVALVLPATALLMYAAFVPPSKLSKTLIVGPVAPNPEPLTVMDDPSVTTPETVVTTGAQIATHGKVKTMIMQAIATRIIAP